MRKPNAKERILETAGKLFMERGYSEVGINEIINTAETAKASFYQHFPSKEALCETWLETLHDRSETHRGDLLNSDMPVADKVDRYFSELADWLEASQFRGCPFSNTSAVTCTESKGINHQISSHKESIRGFFEAICEGHFANSETDQQKAGVLFLLYSGATTEAQNLRDLWPVETARKAAAELMKNNRE